MKRNVVWVAIGMVLWLLYAFVSCGADPTEGEARSERQTDASQVPEGSKSGEGASSDQTNASDCIPSKDVWDKLTQALVKTYCGKCHGEQPNFGAPYSLLSYDELLKGVSGKRVVDRMVARLANKTMPPISATPAMPHNAIDTLTEWASCGKVHPDHTVGLTSTAPVFKAPQKAPEGIPYFDLRANQFEVGADVIDHYQCFWFKAPVKEDRFIRRIEVLIDESRVLHHVVVTRDKGTELGNKECSDGTGVGGPGGAEQLFAWAPGGDAIEFPEGSGLRIRPGDRITIQIHYNNGAGIKDVKDSSGMRFYHTPPTQTEYAMLMAGPFPFSIPPGETKSVSSKCTVQKPFQILAGLPHMHEIGSEFQSAIIRKNGVKEDIILLKGWSFEAQLFYELPYTLQPGDTLETRCTFKNTTNETVVAGQKTKDEMCFNFLYVTPLPAGTAINGARDLCTREVSQEKLEYKPGSCAPSTSLPNVPTVQGSVAADAVPTLKGGTFPQGAWKLKGLEVYLPKTLPVQIDKEKSQIQAAGQMTIGAKVAFDVTFQINLAGNAPIPPFGGGLSFSGTAKPNNSNGQNIELSCGTLEGKSLQYEEGSNTLKILVLHKFGNLLTTHMLFTFEKAE